MAVPETRDGTAEVLLREVVERLREKVQGLTEATCFITDTPIPPDSYFPAGDLACTVAISDGAFNANAYDAAGANQLTEKSSLVVSIFTRTKVDQPPRAEFALLSEKRGLLTRFKPHLLRAILVDDIEADILSPWQPMRKGQPILRGAIVPVRSQGPRQIERLDWVGLSLWFGVEFDWDLRAPVTT